MTIDLTSFERELIIDEQISPNEIDLETEHARLVSDANVKAVVRKDAASTTLKGRLTGELEIDCDRCLEPTKKPIDIELDVEFVTPEDFSSGGEHEIGGEDLKIDAVAGDQIDLNEIVHEQILLDLPQQFFCREDCKGLCPECGANLNLIDCDCGPAEIDPRWAALKNLN